MVASSLKNLDPAVAIDFGRLRPDAADGAVVLVQGASGRKSSGLPDQALVELSQVAFRNVQQQAFPLRDRTRSFATG